MTLLFLFNEQPYPLLTRANSAIPGDRTVVHYLTDLDQVRSGTGSAATIKRPAAGEEQLAYE